MPARIKQPTAPAPLKGDQIYCTQYECYFPLRECIQRHITARRARGQATCRDCIPILDHMPLIHKSEVFVALSRLHPRWVSAPTLAKKLKKVRQTCENELHILRLAKEVETEIVYNNSGLNTVIYRLKEAPGK